MCGNSNELQAECKEAARERSYGGRHGLQMKTKTKNKKLHHKILFVLGPVALVIWTSGEILLFTDPESWRKENTESGERTDVSWRETPCLGQAAAAPA
jgi:hypothetical protein